jgi:hypothetical protein
MEGDSYGRRGGKQAGRDVDNFFRVRYRYGVK